MKILVAGATGYLGKYLVKELLHRNMQFKAIARNVKKLKEFQLEEQQLVEADVTKADDLKGVCDGVDVLISTVGITRQKDGLSYMDVDFQANKNLLDAAIRAGVKQFIYIAVINGESFRHLKLVNAKESFVDELIKAPIQHTIIRPNGFFSDMLDFLEMAKKGKVYLFGKGVFKLNPIHGEDLAVVCVDAMGKNIDEIIVGGPDILSQNEIAMYALEALKKPVKIVHLPDWIRRGVISFMRLFFSSKTYGPIEFFLSLTAQDNIAPRTGVHRIHQFFNTEADKIK